MASLFESLGINDEEQQAVPVKPEKAGVMRTMGDIAIKGAQGVVDLGASAVGLGNMVTGGLVGKGMDAIGYDPQRTNATMSEYLSSDQQAADQRVQDADGFFGTIEQAVQEPRFVAGSVMQSLPGLLAMGGIQGAAATAIAGRAALATAEGSAAAAGLTGTKAIEAALTTQAGGTAAKAAIEANGTRLMALGAASEGAQTTGNIAQEAQHAGRNWADYSPGALAAGVGTAAIGYGAGKLMGDAGTEIFTGAHTKIGKTLPVRMAKSGISEGVLEEMPQSAQEEFFKNIAMGEDDLMKGVVKAGATGLVTGGAMGIGMGGFHGRSAAEPGITPQQAEADAIRATELVPEAGAMTRAANVGTEAKARAVESAPPVTPEDVFAQELASTQDDIRQSNTLQKMRDSASPTLGVTTDEFLAALSVAGDASARTDLRRLALDNIQGAVEHFKTGANLVPDVPQAPGTELAMLNERATGMAEVNPAPEFDPNTLDGQTRFVDELGIQRAIGGPRALTYDDPAPDAPPPSRQAVPQLQAGDIQNKLGKPFTNLFAAKNVSREAGPGYAPVKLGENAFVVRKVDTEINQAPALAAPTPTATETVATAQVEQTPDVQDVQPTPPAVAPAAKPTDHIGRNNKPLSEGGKPFKSKDEASAARKLQPMLRVVPSPSGKGFALAPKTEAQLAAQDKAAKRLSLARTGRAGVPTAAHEFIAGEGGMDAGTKAEFSFGNNPKVGNRTLFAGARGGMSIEAATEKLIEARYLPQGASHSDTVALINRSFTQPQYTVDGTEVMAAAETATRFEDHLAVQQESAHNDDPFGPLLAHEYIADDVDPKYGNASPELQAEHNALIIQAETLGIDVESILEDAARDTTQGTQNDYLRSANQKITNAITGRAAIQDGSRTATNGGQERGAAANGRSDHDGGQNHDQQAQPAEPTGLTPTAREGSAESVEKFGEFNPAKLKPDRPGVFLLEDGEYQRFEGIWFRGEKTPQATLKTEMPSGASSPKDRFPHQRWMRVADFSQNAWGDPKALTNRAKYLPKPEAQSEGLTAPSRAEVLAQQERADNAQALDDRAQIDAEASRQTLTRQSAPEQRTDTSGDMFAVEKAQAVIDKRNAGVEKAKDPNQAGMFDEPAQEDADELSQPIDQLRKIARDDDHPDSQEARSELARHGLGYGHGNSDHLIIGSMKPPSEEWMQVQNFRQRGVYELAASDLKRFLKLAKARSLDAFEGQAISDRDSTISKWLAESKPTEPANQATAILDAANITGKERIESLKDVKKGDITTEELEAAYPAKESASKFASDGVGRSEAEKELQAQSHEKEAPGDVLMANGRFVAFDAVVKMAREGIATGEIRPAPAQMHVKLDMSMRDADRVLKAATEARKAAQPADAAHAQDMTYTAASKIDTPAQGELSNAKEQKERAFERLKNLHSQVNDGRSDLRLELIKAESAHKDALRRVSNAQDQIEKDANKQGLTTIKPKQAEQGAAMFSRRESSVLSKDGKFKGWPKFNAWTRQEYSDVVSLLPDAYRNDAHRREPVAAKDWDALAAAVLPELEAINNAAGEGAFRLDPLGNIVGDVRRHDSSVFASELVDIANRHDLGIFLTGLRTSSMAPLAEMGFTPEMGLGAILARATGSTAPVMPMASGTVNNTAYGTMMSYRPRGFAAPMFSKAESGASQQPTRGTPVPRVQAVVDAITANWANAPEVVVVTDMQDTKVPQRVREADQLAKSQGAEGEPDGFIYKGTVYLVAAELPTINDAIRVLFHEALGHSGLRGAFGDALKPILNQVAAMRRADIVTKAREYGLLNLDTQRDASVNEQWQAMSEKNRQVAAEEVLAVMAQTQPELGFVKRAVSAIRNWLRANVPGFKSLEMTDADIIQAFILPARRHIEGGQAKAIQPIHDASLAALSRSQAPTDPDIRYSRATVARNSWDGPEASGFDDLVYKLQDKQIDTKRVVEAIKAKSSVLADEKNVYLQEELFHGRAAARTEDFVNKELGPLVNMMKMRGIDIPMLDEYLHARHAEEANKLIADRNKLPNAGQLDATGNVIESPLQDGGSGMTTQAARDYLAKLTPAERTRLDAVAAKVDDILANTRQLYADYDLESQDKVDGWGTMFKHYVPLMREDKDGGMGIGQGFSIKGKEVKGRTGSTRKVVDILANIALQRERAIVRGEKNRVATALVGLVKLNPNKEFWHVGPPPAQKVYDPDSNSVVERQDPMYKSRDNVVVAKIKGKDGSVSEQAVTFNEGDARAVRMASALKNLDAAQLEGLLSVSAKITRYFAAINTQYNPIFGTVNLVRDVQGALFNLSSTPLNGRAMEIARYTMSALKGIYLDARAARNGKTPSSQWATLWEEFQDEGGQTGFRDLFANSADRAKAIERELNPTAWMDGPLGKVFTANGALKVPLTVAQKKATGMLDWLSDYNLAMENAVRLATYKVAKEQGISKQQSASLGKNLTVNFNRKGQVGQQAGALYAFFNASMQGTARLGQTLFDMEPGKPKTLRMSATGKKIVYGGVLLGAMQALLLAAAGFDDEEPPDFVRERSLIIPTGGKTYITIPMPLGLHVLPNMGRIPMEFAMGGGKDPAQHVAKILSLLAGSFNPIGGGVSLVQMLAPTAIDPLVAIAENKDWTGKPIAKTAYNKATPGNLLAKDTATYPAKVLAEAINIMSGGTEYTAGVLSPTPDQIDYLFGQVTGGVGREASKLQQSASAIYSGEDLPVHKVPLVGRFYGDTDTQSAQSGKFYSAINKLNVHEAEIKGLRKDGRGAEAAKYIQENPDSRLFVAANFAEREVQKLRAAKRALITKGAPADEVKAVETRINDRMTRFNQTVQRLREKSAA